MSDPIATPGELPAAILALLDRLHCYTDSEDREELALRHGLRRILFQDRPELQSQRVRLAAYALRMLAVQQELVEGLGACGVRALAMKGVSLSLKLHGELGAREFGDLDIMVPPEQAPVASEFLLEAGYKKVRPTGLTLSQESAHLRYGKAQSWVHSQSGVQVDLHWRLLSNWIDDALMEFEELWERSQLIEAPGAGSWRTLGAEDTLVFLALHGAQDGWVSLKQVWDMCQALLVLPVDWEQVWSISGRRRPLLERSLEMCVRLTGISHPVAAAGHYRSDEQAFRAWLEMALSDNTPQMKLLRREFWDCGVLMWLSRVLRATFTPAVDDIASVNLPQPLVGFYPLVRAFRLLGKALHRHGVGAEFR